MNGTDIELTQAQIDAGEVLTTVAAPAEGATLTVEATITDKAGNVSEKGTDSAILDTTAAGAPGVTITEDGDNDGYISAAELSGDVNVTISLTGTNAVAGDTLTVNGTDIELTQAQIDAGEVLTTVAAPAEGATLTVEATITDKAGNVSEKGTDSAILDTTAAGAPGVTITEDGDNDGYISAAELSGDVNVTISLTGTNAVAGDTLTVNGTDIELTQAQIDAGEVLTTVAAPAEGATLTVEATITDKAGNVSEKGTDSAILDTTAAGAPGVTITEDGDNDGYISAAELSGDVNVTISLTGTNAVAGDTLTVNGTDIELTQAQIDAGEVLTTVAAPAEGATLTVEATITDKAGNVSEKGTDSAILDTTAAGAPGVTITEDGDNDGYISAAELSGDVNVTISLTGTNAVAGDTLTVNGTDIELTQAQIDAGEVLTTVAAPAEGATLTVEATITDKAGNVSEKGTDSAILDTTAAGAPGVTITEDGDNDGYISAAELSGDVNVTISLTGTNAVAGDTLTVNGTDIELTQAQIDAGEVLTTVAAPAEGATLTVEATITDKAGNVSEKGTDSAILDTTAAGAPGVTITEDGDNDGYISAAELSGDVNVTISLTGTNAVAGDTLTVNGTDIELTQAQIDAGEVLTTVAAPAEGATLTVEATITDKAGNVSEKGTDSAILDTTAAGAPGVTITEDGDNDGYISAAELSGDVNVTISLTGTNAVAGDTLTVNGTDIELTQAQIDAGEVLTTVAAPAEGATLTVEATITDKAGNVSEKGTDSAILDTTAAGAPGVTITEDGDNDGYISAAELSGDVNVTISLTGTNAVAGDTLTVNGTDIELTQAQIDAGEVLTTVAAPAEGATLTVEATITDKAGNVSEKGTDSAILDTTAAGAPGVTITEDGDNDGYISAAELSGDVNVTISLTGTNAVAGDTLTVNGTDIELTQAQIDAGEVLTTVAAPAEGATLTVEATITDKAGNVSEKGTDSAILDTTAAGAPGVTITEDGDNDGYISAAELSGDVNVTISLTGTNAVAGDTLTVNGTDIELTQAQIDAGEVLTTVAAPAEGATLTVEATITDKAGNVSEKGTDSAILDTTAAGAPGVTITEDGDNDGYISAAELSGDVNVTISLTGTNAVAGDTLTVNGTDIELTQAQIDAGEVLTTVAAPAEGATLTVEATITDKAGNVSEKGTDSAILDTTAAGAPGVTITEDGDNDGYISAAELSGDVNVTISLTGTNAVAGDTLTVNGTDIELTQAQIDAGEVLTTVAAPAEGATLTVEATITDKAGNVSEKGTDSAILDTTAAGAPGVTITEDGDNDGYISAAELSGDVNVTISLTGTNAVAGDTLTVNGTDIELTQAQIDAGEVLTTVAAPAEGATLTVEATITDKAGNVSEKGTDSAILDTTAAGAPGVTITEDGDNDGYISAAELSGDVNVTISLTGTNAVAGDTLTVNGTDIELTQAQIDAGEVLTTVAAPAEGATLTVEATITDKAGNVSEKGTDSAILDTTAAGAPGVTITEDGDNDGYISAAELSGDVNVTISLTGTNAVAGDTLTVNGTDIELTQAQIDAGEVLTTVAAPAEGATLTVEATITDKAGNVSEKGTDSAILDTTAAGAPGVTITEDGDNDGYISAAELSGDVNVTISLTGTNAVAGDTLTVNGTDIELTQAQIDAGEVLTTVAAPAEGATLTVEATITDKAGNVSEKGTDSAILDTTAAGAPGVTITEDGDNDGYISAAELSGDVNVTISLTGTNAVAGDTLTVNGTDIELTQAQIDAGEVLTTVAAPAEGATLTVEATITDKAGNVSEKGTDSAILDTTAAGAPGVTITEDGDNDGYISAAELSGDVNVTISLTGTNAVAGDTLTVNGTDIELTQAQIDAGEVLTTVAAPAEGATLTVEATITDKAGNVSEKGTDSAILDTTAAGAPGVTITEDGDNDGYISAAELSGDVNVTISLTGTNAVAGDTLTVNGTDIELTQAQIDAGEVLTTVAAPAEGATLTVEATITDKAGNVSEKGTDSAILDTTAAGAPGVTITEDGDNDGYISAAELSGDVNVTISLTGTNAVAGDTLTVNGTDIELTQAQIDAGEVLTTVAAPAEGATLTVEATITDKAGNVSEKGTDSAILDTTAAGAPGVTITEDGDNDGYISAAELSGDVNVTISLTGTNAVAGDTLTVNGTDIELTQAQIDAGEVLTTVAAPAEGATLTVEATITDKAGNVSEKGTDSAILDTTAAGAPGVTITEDGDNDGYISAAELSGDVNVTISLTGTNAVAGDTLTVNGTDIELTQAQIDAGEVLTTVAAPAEGATLTVEATITDKAGNVSEKGTDSAILDTTAAGAPGVTITEDGDNDGYISAAELSGDVNVTISLTGTNAVAGDTLTVNGTDIELTQAQIDAGEVLTTVAAPAEGATLTVEATITDKAGNVSEKGTDSAILDTTAAGAPGVTITEDGDNDGYISAAELSGDVNVTISLTGTNAVAGDTLTVNGTDIELTQAQIDAGEVLTTVAAPAEGATLTVEATITDKAGNVSEKGTDSAILDTTAAGAPGVTITEDGDNDGYISAAELSGDVNVTISLTGTNAVAGDTLTVNGTDIELTQAQIDAGEVLTTVAAPAEGATLTVEATITDKAGNVSEKGTDSAILDTTAAGAPGVTITEDGDNDGYISAAELSGDVNVTISLTGTNAVAGDTLTVNGTDIELTQAQIDAGEVLTTVAAPAEGATLTVEATITDKAGNVSEKGTDSAILDTTAAGAPGVTITEDGDNDGYISAAELSGDVNVTISLTGTNAVAGDTLTVNGTDIELTQAQIDAGEVLTTVAAPAEGATLTVEATITDKAGNVSEKGTDSAILDTTAAGAPGVTITEDGDNDGYISAAELSGDVNVTISLTGTNAVAGDTLTVNGTDIELTQAQIDAGEVLTTVAAPAEGATLTVEATITDKAGNVSEKGTDSAILDTTAAGAPGVTITEDGDNDGYISAAELSGDVNVTISLTGTNAVAGDTLTVNGTDIELTQAQIDAGEVLTTVAAPAEGATLTVEATITDKAGNVSEKGTDSAILDTTAAGAPGVTITEDGDNDGYISAAELSGDVNVTISLTGTNAVAGDTLTVNGTDIELTQAQIDAGEVLTTVAAPAEGATLTVEATITDKAGNVSEKGTDSAILDTTAAGAPGVTITEDGDNDGYISAAELSGDVNVTISLTGTNAVAGDTLTVNGTDIELTQAQIDAGEVLTTVAAPAEGATLTVEATITDKAGNVSEKGTDSAILDTIVLAEIDILNIAGDHKISADESNADVTVVGYVNKDAQPNDKIDFYVNGELIGSGFVSNEPHLDAHGNQIGYKFEFVTKGSNLIPDGEVDGGAILTAKVTVSDVAGNTFVATTTEPYFFDIDAPDAPTITKVTDDSSGSDYSVVTLHGTGSEPGNEVEVFAKDANGVYVTIGTATVQQDLSWTLDISNESAIPLNDNEFLYAKEKDSFGNVSEASNTVHYYHGTYDPALAESTDDFVLLGSGDDLFKSNQDDANNKLVVDGGAGNDTAELNFASTNASVALNTDGSVTITEANGDVNTFIEFENFKFTDGTKTTSELFAPKVSLERDQDDVINSDRSTVGYTITLPVGAVVGAMLTIVIEGVTQSFALEPEHIAAGTISGSIDSGSVVGDELSISAEITYGNQPSHLEFKDSDQLAVNEGPQGNDFVVTLSPDSSVIGFDFETESTADGQQIDVVTDREDDANSTDAKETTISFDSLPVLGTVYVVNSDGSRTEVTKDTVVKVTDKLEYDLHDDVNDKLSFDAQTDFKGVYADDTVTSFVLDSGVIISGGHYTGSRPDTDSSLTPDELFFDNADNEKGLGVGSSELDVSTKDYISVDFSQISQGKTDVLVKEANVTFGSVWGNYNDTSSADAQIHVLVFKDGQVVQEFIYDDDQQPIYDGSGVFTANIKVDGGFDEIRVYTTHGTDNPNDNGNSNVTLQSVEVVDAAVSEEVVYEATDSDKGTDKGTIDFVTDSTETSTNNAPHLADTRFSEVGTEDTEISLNLGALNPTDPDGDAVYISNVSVDPSYGSLVLTHDANGVVTSAVFKPAENKHFDDVPFTVTVSDGHKTDTATVMLEVKAVADAPNVTVVFGDSVTTNVTMDSTLHTKLVNGQVLSEADKAALGVTGVVVEVNRNATGTNGSEVLFGSAQADTMYGKYGNDVFVGGAGDDKIDGDDSLSTTDHDGVDTVIYSGPLSNYTLVNNGDFGGKVDQWAVFDSTGKDASARTGTSWELTGDHLYEIERLVFSDAIVTLNPDGTYHVEQITETVLNLSASVADRDGSEYLDEVQIKGLPDGTMIIDKDTGETLGGFQNINGEQVWVIDIEGNSTQSINYDNLVVRTPSSEALDVDVHVVAKENSLPQSDVGASTEVNAAASNDVLADQGGEVPTTLISLVIDSSGSMASKPTGLTESRIEYVLEASIELLKNVKSQQGSESVLVQMIDFDTDATHATNGSSSVWMTVTQAISVLNSALANVDNDNYNGIFDAEGWTNYDQGVDAVMAGYQDATVKGITGDTNDVIYFLSDGAQNQGTIGSDWAAFIKGKDVTAVGVGSEANVPSSGLIQVSGSADNIVYIPDEKLVTDLPKLRPTIGTAGSLLMSVSGDDATEVVIDATKAQVIQMIDTDSSVINMPDSLSFSVDSVSNELLVSTLYGDFRIGQDGSYYFQPDSSAPKINTGQSVAFEVLMTVKDVSGVESEQLVTLNVSPNGESNAAATSSFNASTGDDQIRGTDNNDIILGHAGNDVLDGGLGDDLLFGGAGSDLLIGGLGNDILTGGDGADIFKWVDMETARDRVTDFNASQGDKLDLADLFDDMSKADIDTLLADLGSGDNQGAVGDVSIRVSDDASASHLTIVKGGQTLTIDFDGASAADITSSLMDNLNHLKD
ncbi:VWA domain-containing protein [Vibrio vulnificus]|uniref:type I secretion C-terminal target domain-containing protein n=3 Tax=Vibrio vulnificus TaxID=672 RepID=UPI001058D988|nr:type I secretion C-terminal target domain-containing protein [Vibrio vulnificus]QBN13959.1 VWA domain-containing protein [Vibrio vulnificus]